MKNVHSLISNMQCLLCAIGFDCLIWKTKPFRCLPSKKQKTSIQKQVSMHTLRHSFATHLLEDGVDIHTIQHLLGHADLIQTLVYLHVAQVKTKPAHSPLDTLYNIITL